MSYFTGLVEGFQGRREEEYTRNAAADAARRGQEGKIFEYLLQSQDPEMRALALSGMFESGQPGKRKGGLSGYLGEVQGGSFYPQVLARMNEMVPDEGVGGGPAPPQPGSAGMSTNQPVRPGSEPIQLPGRQLPPEQPPSTNNFTGVDAPMPPDLEQQTSASPIGIPPPPPESKWKRRGTGVATAEEIAETTSRAQLEGRIKAVTRQLTQAGATPNEIQDAILGLSGAPRNQRQLSAVAQWGVQLTPGGPTVPVLLDQTKGYVTAGGQPLPPGAQMIRMSGGGAVPRSAKEPDQQSSTGWSRVYYDTATGEEMYRVDDTPFVPPPAYAGTTTLTDDQGVTERRPVLRGGGVGPSLGDIPDRVPAQGMTDAQGLLRTVDAIMRDQVAGGRRARLSRDQVTAAEAQKLGMPFKTYGEAERASRSTPPVTRREQVQGQGGSLADQIRQFNQEESATPTPPPPQAPVRGRQVGPGPRP